MNTLKSSIVLFAAFIVVSSARGLELVEVNAQGNCFPLCDWEDQARSNIRFGSNSLDSEIPTLHEVTEAKLRHGGLQGGLWPEFKYRTQWEPFPVAKHKCEGMGCLTELLHDHRRSAGSR